MLLNAPTGFGAGSGGYRAQGINFDGANDYLTRGAGLTGAVDAKVGTVSFWFRMQGGDGVLKSFIETTPALRMSVTRNASNKVFIRGRNPAAGNRLIMTSTTSYTAGAWHHVLLAWDLAVPVARMFIDDVDDEAGGSTESDDVLDYTLTDHSIGAQPGGGQKLDADLADLWFDFTTFQDPGVVANRRKFIRANLKPVNLGADGSFPTGSAPIMYFSGRTVNWHTNKGGGGGFTEQGALTDAATSPSD